MKKLVSLTFAIVTFLTFINYCKAIEYELTTLGTLGGTNSRAYAINNNSQIVGRAKTENGEYHAFLWENNQMIDLGTLGGNFSEALAINNVGQIVGTSHNANGDERAFLWENGQMIDIGSLNGNSLTYAYSINDYGQIVGRTNHRAFLWEEGVMVDIGTLGGIYAGAYGINNLGQIAGTSSKEGDDNSYGFLWENGVMTEFGGSPKDVFGINNTGQVVGWTGSPQEAFIWEEGTIDILPSLDTIYPTRSQAVNDSGQVVGYSITNGQSHAVLWENGEISDLHLVIQSLGWTQGYRAWGINNNGWIVGDGSDGAFLLTPEPATLLLLGLGGLVLRRRKQ